ncbi:3-deoxy-7-phosphoheptulonate synthase, partial [bacterium]|nr:3-deoxy-7-phosphoheptulonate synthase [bacterium]
MAYLIEKTIKSQKEVKEILSLDKKLEEKVLKDRQEIIDIIESKDNRKILILGPCSAWPLKAVEEYALRIKEIEKKYSDKIKFILRVYTQKPRTSLGWTGTINQVNPFLASNIEEGILKSRELMINILKIGLPIADEALFTHNEGYLDDLLSWIAIGARSSEDQEHRIYASMIEHPVGLKNPSSGNINIAVNSVLAAQHSHVFLFSGKQIRTFGNEHAHLVLRGGNGESNIYLENLINAKKLLIKNNIKNPSIIIDCS